MERYIGPLSIAVLSDIAHAVQYADIAAWVYSGDNVMLELFGEIKG